MKTSIIVTSLLASTALCAGPVAANQEVEKRTEEWGPCLVACLRGCPKALAAYLICVGVCEGICGVAAEPGETLDLDALGIQVEASEVV